MNRHSKQLLAEMEALGPWHMQIEIADGLHSGMTSEINSEKSLSPSLLDQEANFKAIMCRAYPNGLADKTFADYACNAGGYCFWAKDLGASGTYGFDVREHWINQAKFVREHRQADTSDMRFDVMDLYDLPKSGKSEEFDIGWFSGIFYHLPDPVSGLKIAADRTRELIYISTATQNILDPEPEKGALFGSWEGTDYLMTGVHNLNWFPSGPNCLKNMLRWMGFPHCRVVNWRKQVINHRRPGEKSHNVGRLAMVASREEKLLESFPAPVIVERSEIDWSQRGARTQ